MVFWIITQRVILHRHSSLGNPKTERPFYNIFQTYLSSICDVQREKKRNKIALWLKFLVEGLYVDNHAACERGRGWGVQKEEFLKLYHLVHGSWY